MAKRSKKQEQTDELDTFTQAGPERALMLVLWKLRHHYPEMAVPITAEDIRQFEESVKYTKQTPKVVVFRRPAQSARAAVPASGKRRAVAATMSQPAGNLAVVMVVEANTEVKDENDVVLSPGDAIRPVESNEKEHSKATKLRQIKAIKEKAPQLASDLMRDASAGMYSDSKIQEAAQALVVLAGA